ncbi:T9SS type A sorting domain-containing protein [Pseudofulvibacter geojedonensis]|uniref:T9SS type A sorting domain-containing protein n=1 Tax=Pseudofulvibacter geojedonensis TaxID=1123758 RepID=A0ABW3I1N7_9FLAO
MFTRFTLIAISLIATNYVFSQSVINCNQTSETLNGSHIAINQSYPNGSVSGCYTNIPFVTNSSAVAFVNNSSYTIAFTPPIQQVDFEMIGISSDSNDTFTINVNGINPTTDSNTYLTTNSSEGNPVFDNSSNIIQSHDTGIQVTDNLIRLAQNTNNTYSEGGGTLSVKNEITGISSVSFTFTETGSSIFPPDSAAFEIWLKQSLSVTNYQNDLFQIYPNPTVNNTYIGLPNTVSKAKIEIFSLTGKRIYNNTSTNIEGQIKLNTSSLSNGMYFLKITTDLGVGLKKLMKQS